jgi:hypothetical protein
MGVGSTFTVTAWINTTYYEGGWSGELFFNSSQLNVVSVEFTANGSSESAWFYDQGIYAPLTGAPPFLDYVIPPTFSNSGGYMGEPSGFGEIAVGTTVLNASVASLFTITFEVMAVPPAGQGNFLTSEVYWDPTVSFVCTTNGVPDPNSSFGNFTYTLANPQADVGARVNIYPGASSVQYVDSSDYFYVSHGWVQTNWSSIPLPAQTAFLDPTQTNFTLETNASGFANPPLTQVTSYNGTGDSMSSLFSFQFVPGDLAPGAYLFTGTWEMDAAANPPNYTAEYFQNTITLVVDLSQSQTLVSCSPNSVSAGSLVTCTATVSAFNVTGTVTWSTSSSTGNFLYTGNSSIPVCTLSSGTCSINYTDTSTGYATITASYSGDSDNLPSVGNTTLTVFVSLSTGTNVTVNPTSNLELTFANVTTAGIVVANETPTVPAPSPDQVGEYYVINVTAGFSGNVTVSLAFDGSNMTQQQKDNLTMIEYTPIVGNIVAPWGLVTMKDVAIVARAFGSTPGASNWNPAADLNGDGKVDMKDIALEARHFGFTANWVNITTYVDTTNNIIYGNTTHFSFIGIH